MKKLLALLLALTMVFALVGCGGSKDFSADYSDLTQIRFSMTEEDIRLIEKINFHNPIVEKKKNDYGDSVLVFSDGIHGNCKHTYVFSATSGFLLFFTYSSREDYRDEEAVRLKRELLSYSPDEEKTTVFSEKTNFTGTQYRWYGTIDHQKCSCTVYIENGLDYYETVSVGTGEYNEKKREYTFYGTDGTPQYTSADLPVNPCFDGTSIPKPDYVLDEVYFERFAGEQDSFSVYWMGDAYLDGLRLFSDYLLAVEEAGLTWKEGRYDSTYEIYDDGKLVAECGWGTDEDHYGFIIRLNSN